MSAQYGRGAGAVVTVNQKSGGNKLHGSIYEQNRNDLLNANDFFTNRQSITLPGGVTQKLAKPKYVRNQFGGEVDGPIRKDKTFFAFAYDQVELRTVNTDFGLQQVPTPKLLAGMSSGAGPLAQQYLTKYPIPTSSVPCPNGGGA